MMDQSIQRDLPEKVVFLDIDGVLAPFIHGKPDIVDGYRRLSSEAMERLNSLCAEEGAVVVICSSWRLSLSEGDLLERLTSAGFTGELHPDWSTPNLAPAIRGSEIDHWLAQHGDEIKSWVILDDQKDYYPHQPRIDINTTLGLQDEDIGEACRILRDEYLRSSSVTR